MTKKLVSAVLAAAGLVGSVSYAANDPLFVEGGRGYAKAPGTYVIRLHDLDHGNKGDMTLCLEGQGADHVCREIYRGGRQVWNGDWVLNIGSASVPFELWHREGTHAAGSSSAGPNLASASALTYTSTGGMRATFLVSQR